MFVEKHISPLMFIKQTYNINNQQINLKNNQFNNKYLKMQIFTHHPIHVEIYFVAVELIDKNKCKIKVLCGSNSNGVYILLQAKQSLAQIVDHTKTIDQMIKSFQLIDKLNINQHVILIKSVYSIDLIDQLTFRNAVEHENDVVLNQSNSVAALSPIKDKLDSPKEKSACKFTTKELLLCGLSGVAQIISGIFIELYLPSFGHLFSTILINEGVMDIKFLVEALIKKEFKWSKYKQSKKTNAYISGFCVILDIFLIKDLCFQFTLQKLNVDLVNQVITGTFKKCFQAIIYTLSGLGVDQVLTRLRTIFCNTLFNFVQINSQSFNKFKSIQSIVMRVLSNLTPKRCHFLKNCLIFLADRVKSLFTNKRASKFVLRALKSVKSVFKSFGRIIKNSKDKLLNSFMASENNNSIKVDINQNTNKIIEEVQEIEDTELNYEDDSIDIDSKLDYISNYVKEIDLMIHAYRFSDFLINIMSCAWTTLNNFDQAVRNYIKSESTSMGHQQTHNHDFLNKSTYELLNFTLKKIQDLLIKPEAKSWVQDVIKFLCDAANFPLS